MEERYAIIHAHSHYSLLDSPTKIPELVRGAKEAGAFAVSLTDHGTCAGWVEFMDCCEAEGIKGIPGVEAYVSTEWAKRAHLILLPKNYEGYREISRFISDGNRTQEQLFKSNYVPVSPLGSLGKYFGNGNVIATTACISGPAGSILLGQDRIRAAIEKTEAEMEGCVCPESERYLYVRKEKERMEAEVTALAAERDALKPVAGKKYAARLRGLGSLDPLSEAYAAARAAIEAEQEETERAKERLSEVREELKKKKAEKTRYNGKTKDIEDGALKYLKLKDRLEKQKAGLMTGRQVTEAVDAVLESLKEVFGDDLYAEVQNHGMPEEAVIYPLTAERAAALGIPLAASNDAHMASQGQLEARQALRSMRFEKWDEALPSDGELYIKGAAALREALSGILSRDQVDEAMLGAAAIADSCSVSIPKESHYPRYAGPGAGKDTAALLREKALSGAERLFPGGMGEDYAKRLEYELEVIHRLGYDDYMLITEENVRYAQELCAGMREDGIGYGTGPGRGSAVGSLTAYLLGITKVDPVKYGLIFERFLNAERVSNPDIDSDFSFEVREAAMRHVTDCYGEDCVSVIRTAIKQTAKAAVHASARTLGYELYPMGKGADKKASEQGRRSVAAIGNEIAREVPDKPGTRLPDIIEGLLAKFPGREAGTIIRRAAAIEGTITSMGLHPAGFIISDGRPVKEYIPLLYNRKEGKWGVQCDMAEAEEIGLLKMDFLGLNTLDIITECVRRVKDRHGVAIDPDRLPFEDGVFDGIYSKGATDCVFQVESQGMKKMLREFRPSCFEDIILAIAVYRPGPMDFIPDIVDVKDGKKKPAYILKELEGILSVTYGQPVYQEQLMNIFHECAGFSLGEADIIRRYMAKKKVDAFLSYKGRFVDGVTAKGASREDAEGLWDSLTDFARYAFNKSHAAAYAMLSYQTAWLKYHYPLQFMLAVLNHPRGSDKVPAFLCECARLGIKVLPPDINRSGKGFEQEGGAIRYGLGSVKGVDSGAEAVLEERASGGPFRDLTDFILRTGCNSRVAKTLIEAGAFDAPYAEGEGTIRGELERYYDACAPFAAKLRAKQKLIAGEKAKEGTLPAAEAKKSAQRVLNAEKVSSECLEEIALEQIDRSAADKKDSVLAWEKELLGSYVSLHPLDGCGWLYEDGGITLISEAGQGWARLAGVAGNVKVRHRNSDGKPMCFFELEDPSGSIQAACFPEDYKKCGKEIREGGILKVSGAISKDRYDREGDLRLVVKEARECVVKDRFVLVFAPGMEAFKAALPALKGREKAHGYEVLLFDKTDPSGKLRDMEFQIDSGETIILP